MATKRDLLRLLIQDVKKDVADYAKLVELLGQQRRLMLSHDVVSLIEHNQKQNDLITELHHRATKRTTILKKIGVSPDSKGMKRIIGSLPVEHGQQLEVWWLKLQDLVHQSHALNDQNGNLLARQQEFIQNMLKPHQEESYVYSSNNL